MWVIATELAINFVWTYKIIGVAYIILKILLPIYYTHFAEGIQTIYIDRLMTTSNHRLSVCEKKKFLFSNYRNMYYYASLLNCKEKRIEKRKMLWHLTKEDFFSPRRCTTSLFYKSDYVMAIVLTMLWNSLLPLLTRHCNFGQSSISKSEEMVWWKDIYIKWI